MRAKPGPQLQCLRRASKRGIKVTISSDCGPVTELIAGQLVTKWHVQDHILHFTRGDKTVDVKYQALNLDWLNKEFPIRPDWTSAELRAAYHALIAWDHSFQYKSVDMPYNPANKQPYFFDEFGWASVTPHAFELK